MSSISSIKIVSCVLALAWTPPSLQAADTQGYPNRPIRFIVGFTPGGATDIAARAIGNSISKNVGRPVVVENRPGAGGNIASEAVAKAPPDGYTIMIAGTSAATNVSLYTKLSFDPLHDLAPVSQVTSSPYLLEVNPSLPVTNVKQLIALAKAHPKALNYASAGSGSGSHLFAELFRDLAGIDIVHIPYKGAAAINVVSGEVPMMIDNIVTSLQFYKSKKLRVLAVTTGVRSGIVPELPTMAEAGVPGYDANAWFGVFTTGGTPRDITAKLQAEIAKALQAQELRAQLLALGAEPVGSTPDEYNKFFLSEVAKWAKVIARTGMKAE